MISEIHKQKFGQYKEPFSIKNKDINKIVVSNKVYFSKKGFKYFIGYKNAKKVRPSQKFWHIEKTLMKLNTCPFL